MDKMLRSIFILLLISPLLSFGQKKSDVWRYEGPRIGIDLSRFLMPSIHSATKGGFEIQADYPYKGNWFPTVEAGYQSVDDVKSTFHYTNKGAYARIGFDLNINKFESLSDNDLVFVGVRYGFSNFTQETLSSSYSNYWGTLQSSFPKHNMGAHWGELLFGLKGEVMRNIFFGWTVRAKFKFATTKDPNVTPYVIPGLGYTTTEVPFDFSLTIAYRIPLIKTKTLPKPLKTGGTDRSEQDNDPDNPDPNNPYGNTNSNGQRRSGQQQY